MFPIEFSSKRFCLRTLLWSGLLFESRCDSMWMEGHTSELGMLGSPVVDYLTITITTTIAYKPTLAPGDSTYSLLGCYGLDSGRHPFEHKEGYASPTIPPDKFTIGACLEECAVLKESSDHYEYAGLMNGGECFCGSQLDPEARKLSPEECQTPCSGDTRLSCGGSDAIAVYSRVAADNGNQNIAGDAAQSHIHTGAAFLSSSASVASALLKATDASQSTDTKSTTSEGVAFRTVGAETTKGTPDTSSTPPPPPPPPPGSSGTASTSSTIAAVTGSLSGAIILTALSFLCFRRYKQKKQQQEDTTHVQGKQQKNKRHSRRPVPSAIDTKRGKSRDDSAVSLGVATDFKDMVPTTPALESGGRTLPSGLHVRLKSPSSDRDTLYDALMGEVQAYPAMPKPPPPPSAAGPSSSAASSAVQWQRQWRGAGQTQTPTTASAALFDFDFGADAARPSPAVTSPATAARPEAALGPRAWHRRKLSAPFQPPASGPPSAPLPLTPPQLQLYGMGRAANASARSLGVGSVPPTPPLKDSPTLPRKMQGEEEPERSERPPEQERGATPTGPRDEESTSRPRRATVYVGPRDESEDDNRSEGSTSLSQSTVATSILFPLDDDDDRTWSGA
ncbi:hypothetical protein F4818DRAFT_455145 [Hypoxylon cercidicola]|nr:hypothetical protein F4818DRAFT_455145 [Hypoxylon cercidicola]